MKPLITVLVFFLFISPVAALDISTYSVEYDIQSNGQVEESVTIVFSEPLDQPTQNSLSLGEVSSIQVLADGQLLETDVMKEGNDVQVVFETPASTSTLLITFTAHTLVFQSTEVSQFFTDLSPPSSESMSVQVILPRGFVIFRDTFFPSNALIGSDGERITLTWTFTEPEESLAFSVQYEPVIKTNDLLLPLVIVLAILAIIALFFLFRRKRRTDFLYTFFEDERKVILALQSEKVAYQNTLERRLQFSRAKMTRIIQKLERKGLVAKEKAGRTNRLKWKGF